MKYPAVSVGMPTCNDAAYIEQAVGSVLAHDFGAAREVLSPDNPPLDAQDPGRVLAWLSRWVNEQAPSIRPDLRFKMTHIAEGWNRFFAQPAAYLQALELDNP